MLTLINTNLIRPPIAPVGLEYVATAARQAGIGVEVLDLCLAEDRDKALRDYFSSRHPELIGLSFRNVGDCFWPSAQWFVQGLVDLVRRIRGLTGSPIVIGGVGFSIAAKRIVEETDVEFGVRGDGETAIVALYQAIAGRREFRDVPGLLWWHRRGKAWITRRLFYNSPAWPAEVRPPSCRDMIDNAAYFRRGGQVGVETKRGCNRQCVYCADPLAKGRAVRPRRPEDVADEFASLLRQGADVLHMCDGEFNVPGEHALAVCEELIRRGLGERVRWYTYMAVTPFDAVLASAMRRAGCVGIDFTGDAGCDAMLARLRQQHHKADLATAVRLARENGITTMVDLLLGGPGETPATIRETIDFLKSIGPDCVGAPLGMCLYAGTPATQMVMAEGPPESNPSIRRKYPGAVDFFKPTYYISAAIGPQPAALVREAIAGDQRFFAPEDDDVTGSDHNYNDNAPLVAAIAAGARGAYWDILRKMRTGR